MRRLAAALILTTLVLAGCGGDDDEPSASPADEVTETTADDTADTPPEDAPADDPGGDQPEGDEPATDEPAFEDDPSDDGCPFLTAGPLQDAFGVELEELYGNEAGCSFVTTDGELSVQVVHIDIEIDPETYAQESTSSCDEGTVEEVDAGDHAYACIAIGPTASVFEGDALVNLSVLTTDDEQAVLDGFVEVLPSVTIPS